MPLDPQTVDFLKLFEELGVPPFSDLSPTEARSWFGRPVDLENQRHVDHVEDRTIAGPGGDLDVRVFRHGSQAAQPLVVFFHGGGWVLGDLDSHDETCRHICLDVGAVVVAIDYRLAPEAQFPAAVDDCLAGLLWAVAQAADLGADPARVAVMGDSAGGNLAAVVALEARDRGVDLRHQVLLYPVTDTDFDRSSYVENAEGYLLTTPTMQWFWDHYAPEAEQRADWRAAPILAELAGVCPATVLTAEFDPLRDEGAAYAKALAAAGVDTTYEMYPGMVHGFYGNHLLVDRASDAQVAIAATLKAALA
ncbi:MAG: alpha/beta hydrolase [Actinobacteria bacterium]|nr:alpha/beta hydrolase [Actinomycetota bacterium]